MNENRPPLKDFDIMKSWYIVQVQMWCNKEGYIRNIWNSRFDLDIYINTKSQTFIKNQESIPIKKKSGEHTDSSINITTNL